VRVIWGWAAIRLVSKFSFRKIAAVLKTCVLPSCCLLIILMTGCPTPPKPVPRGISVVEPVLHPEATPTKHATVIAGTNSVAQPQALADAAPPYQAPVVALPPTTKPHPPTPRTGWVEWEQWSEANGWGKPQRIRTAPTFTFEIRGAHGVFEITAGNRTAVWNGLNLDLGFAPQMIKGQPWLHALDLLNTLEPLAIQPAVFGKTNPIIVIDPGHGGYNYGAKSILSDRHEKEFALDWALRLEPLLRRQGWRVFLTRTSDVDVSLPDRVAFADMVKADLFISLHFNSTDQPQTQTTPGGIETYCLTPVGMPSSLTRQYEDAQNRVYPNNAFDVENYHYAARLHRAIVEATQRKDRGVRRARFMGVLREQNRPAVLLEGGYLTHPVEARLIATVHYREKLAQAVAQALMRTELTIEVAAD
jgi:N-acetylmuramoyl-L-alanine amidase